VNLFFAWQNGLYRCYYDLEKGRVFCIIWLEMTFREKEIVIVSGTSGTFLIILIYL
jgi:hypothetical protein